MKIKTPQPYGVDAVRFYEVKLLSSIRGSIALSMFLFGVYWIPRDVLDIGEAGKPWSKMFAFYIIEKW